MTLGRVYVWNPDSAHPAGGTLCAETVGLQRLDTQGSGTGRLLGKYVRVRNGGAFPAEPRSGDPPVLLGDARAGEGGNFIFDPAAGGPRVDRGRPPVAATRERHLQAARFGEVNTYYHLDLMAAYVDALLRELDEPPLPSVTAVVHAHPGVMGPRGLPDGAQKKGRWRPFQGGHYRLPGHRTRVLEQAPVSQEGEIHLGPGWELLGNGALVRASGGPYRHNASHNAGILYHEYGHHVARHTADFRRNADRPPDMQDNRKTSLEEGICDYWAATMLDSPHIWAWHRRHDGAVVHRRSLTSAKTMAEFDPRLGTVDPYANGTIWAAGLWDIRESMGDAKKTDLLLLRSLSLWRKLRSDAAAAWREGPDSFRAGLTLLLRADEERFASRHHDIIRFALRRRGVHPLEGRAASRRRWIGVGRSAHGA